MGKGGYLGGSTIIGPRSFGWFGTGSRKKSGSKSKAKKRNAQAPSQAKSTKHAAPPASDKKKRQQSGGHPLSIPKKGNGLTIPEQIVRARKKVQVVEAELAKTKARLLKLERQLQDARTELMRVQNQPRRSPLGQALAKALSEQQQR